MTELREILKVKEKEREVYVQHLNLSSSDPMYGARLLEQQSTKMLELQAQNDEFERR